MKKLFSFFRNLRKNKPYENKESKGQIIIKRRIVVKRSHVTRNEAEKIARKRMRKSVRSFRIRSIFS